MSTVTDTIVVLSTPGCQRCKFVERYLDGKGAEFTHIDLSDPANSEWLELFRSRNLTNVPQTVVGETWIEGANVTELDRLF